MARGLAGTRGCSAVFRQARRGLADGLRDVGARHEGDARVVRVARVRWNSRRQRGLAHVEPLLRGYVLLKRLHLALIRQRFLQCLDEWSLVGSVVQGLRDGLLVRIRGFEAQGTKCQYVVDQSGELAAAVTQVIVPGDDGERFV